MCWMTCFSRAVPQNYRDTVSLAAALNLAQRKFFPISVMYFSLIISVDTWDQGPWKIRAVRLEIPLNPAPSQSSYMTRLPTVCTWPETPQCGDLQAQLYPSLTCLMWIQATQTLNKHCALLSLEQLMGEDKGDVTWSSWRSSVAGRAEHRDREVILDVRGQELCSSRRKSQEQEVEWWGGDAGTGKGLTRFWPPWDDPHAKTLSTNQQHGS